LKALIAIGEVFAACLQNSLQRVHGPLALHDFLNIALTEKSLDIASTGTRTLGPS
jgi:hypothetical protein